jgi:hypothetical protein
MKKGDRLPISVGGIEIGFAEVENLNDGTVTIFVPAQRAQAAVRMSLETPVPVEPTTETVITGVDRATEPPVEPLVNGLEPPAPQVISTDPVAAPEPVQTTPAPEAVEVPPAAQPTNDA